MAKYLSNRQKNLKVGIVSYTESNTVIEVTGKVGIGTTNATTNLDVNGGLRVRGSLYDNNNNAGTYTYVPVADNAGGWSWQPVTASGAGTLSGIVVQEEGGVVGSSGSITTLDFRGNNIIASATVGGAIATITVSDTPLLNSLTVSGISSLSNTFVSGFLTATDAYFSGNVSIGGTLTYEDVTNIDAVGLVTARSGIEIGSVSIGATLSPTGDASFAGIVTAPYFYGDGSNLTNLTAIAATTANYALVAGISTYSEVAGIATYASSSGIATYADTAGIATYATTSGISTDVIGGIASVTSLNVSGITTLGTVEISSGVVTATSFSGSGINLSGIVTSITAGAGVTIDQSTGNVTIVAVGSGLSETAASKNYIVTLEPAFDGITTSFTLRYEGENYYAQNSQQLIVSLGGVVQEPDVAYTVSGTTLLFSTAPDTESDYFIVALNSISLTRNRQNYNVTGVQTSFTLTKGYTVGYLDVYLNGSRLISDVDYQAIDGSTIDLTVPAQDSDVVEIIGFKTLVLTSGDINTGSLYVSGITTLGTVEISSGIITATSGIVTYYGDGSNLTGVLADYATSSGIATYADTAGIATYSTLSGIATYSDTTGIATYSNTSGVSTNVSGGTASVTSLDVSGITTLGTVEISSGIITATSGIVTYYGDGSKLSNVISGVGIQSAGTYVGTGITVLNFIGTGNTFAINGTTVDISISAAGAGGTWTTYNAGIATSKSVGINTSTLDNSNLTGVGNSFQGLYVSNGMIIVDNVLSGDHYIGTNFNGLMAGPVSITGTLTVDGNYVVV